MRLEKSRAAEARTREKRRTGLFDVEVTFTGLGVVLLRSGRSGKEGVRNPHPKGVELLLLRTPEPEIIGPIHPHQEHSLSEAVPADSESGNNHSHEPHFPRLWFRLDDLATPKRGRFLEALTVDTEGAPTIGLEIGNRLLSIMVTGDESRFEVEWAKDPEAVEPGENASEEAIDWIPGLKEQFGLDLSSIALPKENGADGVYTSRVILPPGRITTRRFLVDPSNNRSARWTFGGGQDRVLADQVVWSRRNVSNLEIDFSGGRKMAFDSLFRELSPGQENPRVTLAFTNLPALGSAGRFRRPTHFSQLARVSTAESPQVLEVRRFPKDLPDDITSGGACPPARAEVP